MEEDAGVDDVTTMLATLELEYKDDIEGDEVKHDVTTEIPIISRKTSSKTNLVTTSTAIETSTSSIIVPEVTIPSNVTYKEDLESKENDKLLYTSERNNKDRVKIILSTLPPYIHGPQVTPYASPRNESMSGLSMCPPRNIRALSWGWTRSGTEATLSCPQGTTGIASWKCEKASKTRSNPYWATNSPDLSDCQSVWMEKIIKELRKSEMIINLASELMQYVTVNVLYGGDIKSAINAMTIISEKMQHQLQNIPTMEQREAMVMELVQSITKTASALLSDHNIPAWQDLPTSQRKRFLSNLLFCLERSGSLLPEALAMDKEVSISSDNLLLTVRKISFRNIHRTQLPSLASLATPNWKNYTDSIQIPALVLMENMNTEASQIIFLSMRNLDKLLVSSDRVERTAGARQVINCQVIHLSFGDTHHLDVISEPLTVMFQHLSVSNVTNPRCVIWDKEEEVWSDKHCKLETTNLTHTTCQCSRLGTFALMEDIEVLNEVDKMTFLVMVIIAISVSIVAFISIILVFLYCQRIDVHNHLKMSVTRADIPCLRNKGKRWSLNESHTVTENLSQTENGEVFDIVSNSDFMTLSRAALSAHDSPYYNQYNPGPQYHPRLQTQHMPNSHHFQSSYQTSGSQCIQSNCPQQSEFQNMPTHSPTPGPQVSSPSCKQQARLQIMQPNSIQEHMATATPAAPMHTMSCKMVSPSSPRYHIYMEVDPLYCSGLTREGELHNCSGMASSNSSQTSSGYSTAPSDHIRQSRFLEGEEYEAVQPDPQWDGPSQEYVTTDRVYSISHNCPQVQRQGLTQLRPHQLQQF